MTGWTIEACSLDRVLPIRSAVNFVGVAFADNPVFERDDEESRHWVAVLDGRDVGGASLHREPRLVLGTYAPHRLRALGVRPSARGLGIGRALVKVRLEEATRQGSAWAWSGARESAVPLYESLGARRDPTSYDVFHGVRGHDVLYGPLSIGSDPLAGRRP